MKSWEILADNLSKAGWSWGCITTVDREGRTIFVADAHRGDGQRFVVHADEKVTAFLELESAIRAGQNSSGLGPTLPAGWRLVTMADFNADGHPDYLLFNPTTQQSQIWYLSGVTKFEVLMDRRFQLDGSSWQLVTLTETEDPIWSCTMRAHTPRRYISRITMF